MKNSLATIAATIVLAAGWTAAVRAETLNLLIWQQYIAPEVLALWTAETGTEIRQIYFDDGDSRDRLLADPQSDIDLAILNENVTSLYGRNGMLVEVNTQTLPSVANAAPRWLDRCAGYGMPYFWGTLGIVYRPDKLQTPPTSWSDLLAPSSDLSGHIAMVTGYDDLLAPPLILGGHSINTENAGELRAAFDVLKAQVPSVRTYEYIVTSAQNAEYGDELFAGLAYSGDQFALSALTGHHWDYVLPKEGSFLWVDCLTANSHSARKELAVRFMDFLNRPAVAALNASALSMPTANATAMQLLPAEMLGDREIYPAEEAVRLSQFFHEYGAASIQLRKRIVSGVTTIHDTQ